MRIHKLFSIVALAALLIGLSCNQVNFTAPSGSTITITAQPPTVAANGVATITITGTRANGAPLADGTTITFTADLGSVSPNPVETKDGVAISRFRAGTRSGEATITASSGGATAVTVKVKIGESRASRVALVATPIQLPVGGGKVNLKAHVFDESGNTLGGVGVIFTSTAGDLDSRGRVIKTNDQGTAFDTLQTTLAATITAETQNGTGTDTADITIGERQACDFLISPTEAFVGQDITFTDISGNTTGLTFLWDFGDGTTGEGQVVTHSYDLVATYTVVHTVIDSQGFSTTCSHTVDVTSGAPTCSFDFSPDAPSENNTVSFDASASTDPSGIRDYTWNFADGNPPTTTTSPFINHTFIFPSCGSSGSTSITVGLIVTDNQGTTNTCSQFITFTCS